MSRAATEFRHGKLTLPEINDALEGGMGFLTRLHWCSFVLLSVKSCLRWRLRRAGSIRGWIGRFRLKECRPICLALVLLAVCLLGNGCSSFSRAWRTAAKDPAPHDTIAGRWEGTWRSDANGHTDRLRCLMTPLTNGFYSARFHAQYQRGLFRFSFGYTVPLEVRREVDTFRFDGGADLGWLAGGQYHYRGTATATNFHSTYESKYDRGVFEMTRPTVEH